jgi:hypothetical protein
VLRLSGCIVILEFKVGEKQVTPAAKNQVWEYALDTKPDHQFDEKISTGPAIWPLAENSIGSSRNH